MEQSNPQPHLVLLSSPGHLNPVIELGKLLVTSQNVKVTLFVASLPKSAPLDSLMVEAALATNLLDIVHFPAADVSNLVEPGNIGIPWLSAAVRVIKPALRDAISGLETPATALIVHIYAIDCIGVADEFKIPKYVFISTNAWFTAVIVYSPVLDKEVEGEFVDKKDVERKTFGPDPTKEAIVLPGCSSVRGEDLPSPMLLRTDSNYREWLRIALETLNADGVLVNTWEELEPKTLASLRDGNLLGRFLKAPIFPVGPIQSDGSRGIRNEQFEWLDKQPTNSVLYISFGSGGGLSLEQTEELAWGLELSHQRFIWVVRPPIQKSGIGAGPMFGNNTEDISSYLPEGFISRTGDRGVLVPHWGPQVEILSHPSCGGFLTHCGWKSTIEGISNGLPMIAWPLFGEQGMNATMLTEEFGISVRSKMLPAKSVVGREEIEKMVRMIFADDDVGRKMRDRAEKLKLSAEKARSNGGSSYNALAEMVRHCQKKTIETDV